jgi:hypothetical protein
VLRLPLADALNEERKSPVESLVTTVLVEEGGKTTFTTTVL